MVDHVVGQAELPELLTGNDAMLALRQSSDRPIVPSGVRYPPHIRTRNTGSKFAPPGR